jgi:hypothetical protein
MFRRMRVARGYIKVGSGIRLLVGVAVVLAASGCGLGRPKQDPPPPALTRIQLGHPHPSGHKVTVHQPLDCSSDCDYTEVDRWPSACDLLAKDEIRAVLPDSATIQATPHDVQINTTNPQGIKASLGTAKAAECQFDAGPAGAGEQALITVDVLAVGTPDAVRADYTGRHDASVGAAADPSWGGTIVDRDSLGPTACYSGLKTPASPASATTSPDWDLAGGDLKCYHGGLEFEVEGPDWDTLTAPVTVVRDSTSTTLHDGATGQAYLLDTASADLVRTIAAALP